MSGKERLPIFPSRGAQMLMKARLAGAQKGHGLLKKKADALQMRFRMILGKIIEVQMDMFSTPIVVIFMMAAFPSLSLLMFFYYYLFIKNSGNFTDGFFG